MPVTAILRVRVTPRSARDEILGLRDGVLLVRLRAPPLEGRANEALCHLVAERLGLPLTAVRITAGAAARTKSIRIEGLTHASVLERLGA